jgi:peptidyl-prolyl cis-trans isomerase D
MLAITNSDDPGSKNNGGEYDNIAPGQMTPKFNDFVFNNPVGTMGVVETEFGFHVMKVSGKNDAVLLGTVAQKIQASDATIDAAYTKASQLESSALENKDFEAVAKKAGLVVAPATNIKAYDEYVQGLGSQREIVRWSFNKETEVGGIKRFEIKRCKRYRITSFRCSETINRTDLKKSEKSRNHQEKNEWKLIRSCFKSIRCFSTICYCCDC